MINPNDYLPEIPGHFWKIEGAGVLNDKNYGRLILAKMRTPTKRDKSEYTRVEQQPLTSRSLNDAISFMTTIDILLERAGGDYHKYIKTPHIIERAKNPVIGEHVAGVYSPCFEDAPTPTPTPTNDTGLPVLPDGQFWRVTYSDSGIFVPGMWYLQIRKKNRFFGSKLLADKSLKCLKHELTHDRVVNGAEVFYKELQEKNEGIHRANSLAGDYPPKRLQ